MNNEKKCTLNNEQLMSACDQWIAKLAESGGNAWSLRVPVDFNYDPDMLFLELINRFKEAATKLTTPADIQAAIEKEYPYVKTGRVIDRLYNAHGDGLRRAALFGYSLSMQGKESDAVKFGEWLHGNQFRRYLQSSEGAVPFGPNKDSNEPIWVSTKIHYSPGFYTTTELYNLFTSKQK